MAKAVDQLCLEQQIDVRILAERSGLDESRALAILLGRWTPSLEERDSIAAVFGLARDQIVWRQKTPIQHMTAAGRAEALEVAPPSC